MNLRQIEVFRAIMLAGSITDAARLLHVSQPGISRMLGHIELQLGLRLFERRRGRLHPTPEAQALYAEVDRVYQGVQRVDEKARDLREGNQGVTGFRLQIGPDGRVEACTVTSSSGHPGLDEAACDNISRRARFEPATDGAGNRVRGTYAGSIRWVIPNG